MAKNESNAYLYEGFISEVKGSLNTGVSEEVIEESVNSYMNENPVTSEIVYSTEERVIGRWVDNKPLYQKTIQLTNKPSANTNTPVDVSDLSVDMMIKIEGVLLTSYDNNILHFAPDYTDKGDYILRTYYSTDQQSIMLYFPATSAGFKWCYITVQYTKTTD